MRRFAISLVLIPVMLGLSLVATGAAAAELAGFWERSTGTSRIRFEPCGDALCGKIAWLRPGLKSKAFVGQPVFLKLARTGETLWTGEAFNPEDGRTYQGRVSIDGKTLTTTGCVLGGLICKSETWKKVDTAL